MNQIIANLFAIRDFAHRSHLKTRSFARHVALGDFYESLLEKTDEIAEIYQGKYGIMEIPSANISFADDDAIFLAQVAAYVESARNQISEYDTNLLNEWDNIISIVYRTKYKIEHLI